MVTKSILFSCPSYFYNRDFPLQLLIGAYPVLIVVWGMIITFVLFFCLG